MTVLSKIFSEQLSSAADTGHHLTQWRHLFLASSALSLATWTTSLVLSHTQAQRENNNANNNKSDAVSSAYLQKNSSSSKQKQTTLRRTIGQLSKILKTVLSGRDYCYAAGIALALLLRTMCDLWMIQNLTQVEAAIIGADFRKLKLNIMEFMYAAPILALVNNGLKYCISTLQLNLRYKITSYLTGRYMSGLTYYQINSNALHSSATPLHQNVDQLLTSDVDRFTSTLVDVYSNALKPLFDVVVYLQRLSVTYTGLATPASMIGYLLFAGAVLTSARRPLTRMHQRESQLEGELRFVHSRLIAHCEEVAFCQGNHREKLTLESALERLREHASRMLVFQFNLDYLDNIITRYMAQVCGYLALSMPFMSARYAADSHTTRLETYYKSGRIMLNMSQSIGRLVSAGRDFNRLAAYTERVSELQDYLEGNQTPAQRQPSPPLPVVQSAGGRTLLPHSGQIVLCNPAHPMIELEDVPLCTPTGDLLVSSLSFKLLIGQNVLITGPNGSGKSSLFRLLGELWPLFGGRMVKPPADKLLYIPQKPYLALGTFRDQLIYPDTVEEMTAKGVNDNDLLDLLNVVQLDYLLERLEASFNSVADWAEVLSGGEKQRVALCRLLYFRPQFAVLDECTSAVSADVEAAIYRHLVERAKFGSILSVTHRVRALERFHDYVLEFDGAGGAQFKLIIDDL